jgi:hypothetical protein
VFVCDYERDTFIRKIGAPPCPHVVVHNGLADEEFAPVPLNEDAADFLFIGEMRRLKGGEDEPFDYVPMFLANMYDEGVTILPAHRVIRHEFSLEEFLTVLGTGLLIRFT